MGLINETQTNKIFLKVVEGKLTQKVKEGTEGALIRTNAKNEEVSEKRFGGVDAYIYDIRIDDTGDFGNQLLIETADKGLNIQIQVPLSSGYAHDFLSRAEGINFKKPVILNTYKIARENNKEKFNYVFVATQECIKVAKRYTKEFPNGLPSAVEKKVGKKTEWDFTEVNNFYYKIATSLNEQLKGVKAEILLLSGE